MPVDTSKWIKFGQTFNADFYQIDEGTLAVVPHPGSNDDAATAKASVEIQLTYLRSKNQKAGCVIFMDDITEQTAGARAVYRELPNPQYQSCYALVGGTVFGRAVGSVFLGLSRPLVPTQMFATLEQALVWCHAQVKNS